MAITNEYSSKEAFRDFLDRSSISYEENTNNDLGEHDFEIIVGGFMDESISLTVDVRCRREPWDAYVFESVGHYNDDGADIYVFSDAVSEQVPKLIGWLKNEDFEHPPSSKATMRSKTPSCVLWILSLTICMKFPSGSDPELHYSTPAVTVS